MRGSCPPRFAGPAPKPGELEHRRRARGVDVPVIARRTRNTLQIYGDFTRETKIYAALGPHGRPGPGDVRRQQRTTSRRRPASAGNRRYTRTRPRHLVSGKPDDAHHRSACALYPPHLTYPRWPCQPIRRRTTTVDVGGVAEQPRSGICGVGSRCGPRQVGLGVLLSRGPVRGSRVDRRALRPVPGLPFDRAGIWHGAVAAWSRSPSRATSSVRRATTIRSTGDLHSRPGFMAGS